MAEPTRAAPKLTFDACLRYGLTISPLVDGFNCIFGRSLRSVPEECEASDLAAFAEYVDKHVWSRLPVECRDVASGPQPVAQQDKED